MGQGLNQAAQDAFVLCKEFIAVNKQQFRSEAELDAAIAG